MKRLSLYFFCLAATLTGCASISDLPTAYTLDSRRSEGLAIISLTLSGKPLSQFTSFEYRIREVLSRGETPVLSRTRYDSTLQQARAINDIGGGQGPATNRIVVAGTNSAEPLDLLDNGRAIGRLAVLRLPPGNMSSILGR